MAKPRTNFWISYVLLFGMTFVVSTGLLMKFILPPGTGGRHEGERALSLWGLTRHEWGTFHFWVAVSLASLVVIHIWLHWKWVKEMLLSRVWGESRRSAGKWILAILTGVAVAVLIAIPWMFEPQEADSPYDPRGGGKGAGRQQGLEIEPSEAPPLVEDYEPSQAEHESETQDGDKHRSGSESNDGKDGQRRHRGGRADTD